MAKPNITEDERDALACVRERLASGEYEHTPDYYALGGPFGFNMASTMKKTDCGTVCCIGGWMAITILDVREDLLRSGSTSFAIDAKIFDYVAGYAERELLPSSVDLERLFYPPGKGSNEDWWSQITPAMAVEAIDAFNEAGDPAWHRVCANIMPVELAA